jgi:OFA family oxalate/formate antiporter-like MFS transporter
MKSKRNVELIIGAVTMLFLGLIYAWSIFREPLSALYSSWSISQISLTFTISMISFCLGGFYSGKKIEKYGHKKISIIAGILLFAGFYGTSLIGAFTPKTALILLYVFYGIFCGFGVGMEYNSLMGSIIGKFEGKAGVVSGVLLMGFGLGGVFFGTAAKIIISQVGLFIFFRYTSFIVATVIFISAMTIEKTKIKQSSDDDKSFDDKNYTPKKMLASRKFWIFFIWIILLNSAGLMVINSAASITVYFGASAILGLIVLVFNGIGRVVIGTIFDRFGRKITMRLNNSIIFISGLILFLGSISNNVTLIVAGLVITGIGYGGNPSIASATINTMFGPKHYPINFSIANFAIIPGAIIGPMVSSYLLDTSNGDYGSTFIVMQALAIAGFFLLFLMDRQAES